MGDGETERTLLPLFLTKLSGFWAQKNPHRLNYTVTADLGHTHMASVPMAEMAKQGFAGWLTGDEARTMINLKASTHLGDFYMSMLHKLWSESASQETLPFGWHETGGNIDGFTFGGVTRFEDGSVKPCGIGDVNIQRYYTPAGEIGPWFEAAKTVTDRQRPELTAIMLVSFAAPLIKIAGHNGAAFSAWGDSGSGKSSAFTVGMAVWGHPLTTKGSQNSTVNNVTTQMAQIRHLPFYWDEIKDDPHRKRVFEVMHDVTDGVEKGRNLTGNKTQDRGSWALPIIAASNGSFREYLYGANHNHAASINRVLEWNVKKIDHGPGHLDDATATQKLSALTSHYGRVGELYADYLAHNHRQIRADYTSLNQLLQAQFGSGSAERYWVLEATALILAARYAKHLGVEVSEHEIMEWVIGVVQDNINQRDRQGMSGVVDNADEAITRYLGERHASEQVIWTNYMHNKIGKPPKPVVLLRGPSQQRNTAGAIEVRVAVDNREVVIARRDFEAWCKTKPNDYALMQMYEALQKIGLRFEPKCRLLSGTTFGVSGGRQPAIVITVDGPDHPLWDTLWQFSPPEQRAAAEEEQPEPTEHVSTGLEEAVSGQI